MTEYTTLHFSVANPRADPDYYSVPKLLRRVAEHIEVTADGYLPWINVYYYYEKGE